MNRTLRILTLVVLACFAGLTMASALPHSHGDLQGQDQCPLHAFTKQSQDMPSPAAVLLPLLIPIFVVGLVPARSAACPAFACGLTRAPPSAV